MSTGANRNDRRGFLGALARGAALLTLGPLAARAAGTAAGGPPSPAGDAGRPLRILFYTDVHAMEENGAPEAMERAAAALAAAAREADVVICGGDVVHGGFNSTREAMEGRLALYRRFVEAIGRPVLHVPGNHDLVGATEADGRVREGDARTVWRELAGRERTWVSTDVAGHHLVLLDAVEVVGGSQRYRGWIGAEQMEWLRADLAAVPAATPLVLVSHIPLRTTFQQVVEGATAALTPNLVVGNAGDVLEACAGRPLRLVLQGHLHVDEAVRFNGTTFWMGGAVCGAWWRGANRGTERGFGTAEVGPDGAVREVYVEYA